MSPSLSSPDWEGFILLFLFVCFPDVQFSEFSEAGQAPVLVFKDTLGSPQSVRAHEGVSVLVEQKPLACVNVMKDGGLSAQAWTAGKWRRRDNIRRVVNLVQCRIFQNLCKCLVSYSRRSKRDSAQFVGTY